MNPILRINIPREDAEELIQLIKLSDEETQQLIDALGNTKPRLSPIKFASEVFSKIPTIHHGIDLVRVITTLYSVRSSTDLNIPEYIQVVQESVQAAGVGENTKINDEQWILFRTRLDTLLKLDQPLSVVSKASSLMTEQENNFHEARILTDLRPIFSENTREPPNAGVIIHQLKISYHQEGRIREFFVALDASDIKQLRGVLQRAEEKEKSLISSIQLDIIE